MAPVLWYYSISEAAPCSRLSLSSSNAKALAMPYWGPVWAQSCLYLIKMHPFTKVIQSPPINVEPPTPVLVIWSETWCDHSCPFLTRAPSSRRCSRPCWRRRSGPPPAWPTSGSCRSIVSNYDFNTLDPTSWCRPWGRTLERTTLRWRTVGWTATTKRWTSVRVSRTVYRSSSKQHRQQRLLPSTRPSTPPSSTSRSTTRGEVSPWLPSQSSSLQESFHSKFSMICPPAMIWKKLANFSQIWNFHL